VNKLLELLDITNGSIAAVIGCGGKTSLIELIAQKCKNKKVLISPTTKILPATSAASTVITPCDTLKSSTDHIAKEGIQCLGIKNEKSGKLEALPEDLLAKIVSSYDIVLLEADGSRQKQYKGWQDNEPVIPQYCSHTIGVVTLFKQDKTKPSITATKETVHNLPEFLSLTGLNEGDIITEKALEDMVCAQNGMFKNSKGQRYLIVNQVEDEETAKRAELFLNTVKSKYPNQFNNLIYGSVRGDSWKNV